MHRRLRAFQRAVGSCAPRQSQRESTRRSSSPLAELLESRCLLSVTFVQKNLVSDIPGAAQATDPNMVNAWGLSVGLNGGVWVAENHSGMASSFDGNGVALPAGAPQSVSILTPDGNAASSPTGVATNGTNGFVIASGANAGPASELFATEDGTIAGWNSSVDPTHAVVAVDNSSSEAIYKGLAMGFNADGAFLYATDFHNNRVDVFDSNFRPVHTAGGFRDSKIPAGYAPFGISAINGQIYVTYAKQDADKEDDRAGPGHGFIDVFDTEGRLDKRFASKGLLNSPWGMAWAPFQGFGKFNNALIVGNFGSGEVMGFDFDSGELIGRLRNAAAKPIKIPGVWGLQFGLGVASSSSSTLFFAAGPGDEEHGLFGTLSVDPASLPAPEGPTLKDPSLAVSTVVSGLNQPTSMAFLGAGDMLVLEKAAGTVEHVVNGAATQVLSLPVNSASERGLLGIALEPNFSSTHGVYLYWTQSKSGTVSTDIADVPVLGNRVDRYVWNGAANTLTFDKNIIMLRSFQADANQPMRGNHDGGKIAFGPDGKLYVQIGDQGRRGQLQNLADGPFGAGTSDDQFGGPQPDAAHTTGVILRLNPDGTAPTDNPFFRAGAAMGGNVGGNIQKIFSYGRRNSFGLAFDPATGSLWESENGDDSFDELNRITAGSNGGWVQIMGPASRVAEFKEIETTFTPFQSNLPLAGNLPFSPTDPASFVPALQQVRFPPSRLADTKSEAMARLASLPGSQYSDPEFSWKWAVAPAAIGFVGNGLGSKYAGDLFVGESRTFLDNGFLMDFKLDGSRKHFSFSDKGLADKVDDNEYKFDEGESDALVVGENFGVVTDIKTGPDGNLYVTSLSNGAIYMISKKAAQASGGTPAGGAKSTAVAAPAAGAAKRSAGDGIHRMLLDPP